MLDKEKFAEGMSLLCETYEREASELLMKSYYMALKDLSDEQFEKAVLSVLQDRKYNKLPVPGEIREQAVGNIEDKATLAYNAFTKGKAQTGIYESVSFADKNIHAVIMAMGGWQQVCLITEDEWKFKRKEFIDLYRAISRHPGREIPDRLIGLAEHGCSQDEQWHKFMPETKAINYYGEIMPYKQIEQEERKVLA